MQALTRAHSGRQAGCGKLDKRSTLSVQLRAVRHPSSGTGSSEPAERRTIQEQGSADAGSQLAASRRRILFGALAGAALLQGAAAPLTPAQAAQGIGRYIKKKKLDPLETYVPLVLEAQEQLEGLKGTLVADPAGAREKLRTGAFSALRDNVRALGEYAAQSGGGVDASALVNGFFRKLEGFDLLLYRAVKEGTPVDGPAAEGQLGEAADALAALIATVPADVLERSRAVLEKAGLSRKGRSGSSAGAPEPPVVQTPEDVELLNELLTVWE